MQSTGFRLGIDTVILQALPWTKATILYRFISNNKSIRMIHYNCNIEPCVFTVMHIYDFMGSFT